MKKIKKIFAGLLSLATLLTCAPLGSVNAEEIPDPHDFSNYKVVEGELHLAKGESINIPNSLAIEIIKIENDNPDVVSIEPFFYDYYAIGLENGTATVSMSSLYNQTTYVWNIIVSDEYKTPSREKELILLNSGSGNPYPDVNEGDYSIVEDSDVEIGITEDTKYYYFRLLYTDDITLCTDFIQWTSENPAIATVDMTGSVKPVSLGKTTITATIGDETFKCNVVVTNVFVKGDISGNGKLDLNDAVIIAKYLIKTVHFDEADLERADYNGDGKVTLNDAVGIAKKLMSRTQ